MAKKYKRFEICDGDYNDSITSNFKEALKAYREAETPRSLYGVTHDDVMIPIYAKQ